MLVLGQLEAPTDLGVHTLPSVSIQALQGMINAINAQEKRDDKISVTAEILQSQATPEDQKTLADTLFDAGIDGAILDSALEQLRVTDEGFLPEGEKTEEKKSPWPWIALGVGTAAFAITALIIFRK